MNDGFLTWKKEDVKLGYWWVEAVAPLCIFKSRQFSFPLMHLTSNPTIA
jgi:hypothetical protein